MSIYEITCSAEAFPIEEARRLQNKYVVGFFRAFLANESDYAALLTPDHAESCEPSVEVWVEGGPQTKSAPCQGAAGQ